MEFSSSSAPVSPASPVTSPAGEDPEEGKDDQKVGVTEKGIDKREDQKIRSIDTFSDHDDPVSKPFKNKSKQEIHDDFLGVTKVQKVPPMNALLNFVNCVPCLYL